MHVNNTSEVRRISALPRREALEAGRALVDTFSSALSLEGAKLRPLQALALSDILDFNGVFIALPVGEGKTLITYLIPTILEKKCLLIVPAKLIDKTNADFKKLRADWVYMPYANIISYEAISTHPDILSELVPEVIVADECHHLSNKKSAVTRRVRRYLNSRQKANLPFWFIPLTGTITKRSLLDYHHLMQWALPARLQCLPVDWYEAREWAMALDEIPPMWRIGLGALTVFGATLDEARLGYGKLFSECYGIITAPEKNEEDVPIDIQLVKIQNDDIDSVTEHIEKYWEVPGGADFNSPLEKARHLKEVSQGFIYEWAEQPPQEWLDVRTVYNRFVRDKISRSRLIDTEMQVCKKYENDPCIQAWSQVKHIKPKTRPVWFTDVFLDWIKTYTDNNAGPWLVWVEHTAVGNRLRELFGWPYYSRRGQDEETGKSIIDNDTEVAVVSISSIGEGFNLQHRFAANIVASAPSLGRTWEQMLGRTHRSGQTECVRVVIPHTNTEQKDCYEQAVKDAIYIESTTKQKQKLLIGGSTGC